MQGYRNALLDYMQQGMQGTPGGPAQESSLMQIERYLQNLAAIGAQYGGGAAGAIGGGVLGAGMGGVPGGAMGAVAGGVAAGAPGMMARDNAYTPDIRDVWLDQLRMKMQGR